MRDPRWRIAGIAGLVLLAAGLPFDAPSWRTRAAASSTTAGSSRRSRRALGDCSPDRGPDDAPDPLPRALDRGPALTDFTVVPQPAGALVTPTETSESWVGGGGEGQPPRVIPPLPPGYAEVAADDAWRVYATC